MKHTGFILVALFNNTFLQSPQNMWRLPNNGTSIKINMLYAIWEQINSHQKTLSQLLYFGASISF